MKAKTKADIDDVIFYLADDSVYSAAVLSIKVVVNSKLADKAATAEQHDLFCKFGDAGVWYKTAHGVYHENQVFLSREDLGKAIAEGSLGREKKDN